MLDEVLQVLEMKTELTMGVDNTAAIALDTTRKHRY
ncbi:hypothetical protein PI124_g18455 [Phytophthora idaei]|nr:hypothetical protein PI125_g19236 [Phytophthora idaei]KAG3128796.1 hypothetical protein PI126_g21236 [Phytophthora idaei]KAG3236536.1 hypothetical protein PI124_g18455 [Phytophthora idaei]